MGNANPKRLEELILFEIWYGDTVVQVLRVVSYSVVAGQFGCLPTLYEEYNSLTEAIRAAKKLVERWREEDEM
jgi:hypothetical protein